MVAFPATADLSLEAGGAARPARAWSTTLRLAAFSSIMIPVAGSGLSLAIFVPQFYAAEFGLPLATIGAIFLVGRLLDAFIDPLVGALSDHTRSAFGRRRPWIAAGGILFALTTWFLFFPPAHVSLLYIGVSLFVFYCGWTMMMIPFSAWVGELSGAYHARTRITTFQLTTYAVGLLLALVLPTLVDQWHPGNGRLKLQIIGASLLVTLLPSLMLTLTALREPPQAEAPTKTRFTQALHLVFCDRLLLRVLFADLAVVTGQYIRAGLIVFFITIYMRRPEWASALYLLQFVFGVAAGPIWLRVGYRLGKHRAAIAGELVQAAINLGLLLVVPASFGLLLGLTIAQGLAQGSGNQMLRAIVGDLADKHRLETGVNRTGLFYSVFALSEKSGMALATGIAFSLVAWLGFKPAGVNTSGALEGLKVIFAMGPVVGHLIAVSLLWRFPHDEARHNEIQRALERRDGRGDHVVAPATRTNETAHDLAAFHQHYRSEQPA